MFCRTSTIAIKRLPITTQWFVIAMNSNTTATTKQVDDPVKQIFINKIREYASKKKSAGDDKLVDATPESQKSLADELNRLAQKFRLANVDAVGKLPETYDFAAKIDSSVAAVADDGGASIEKMSAEAKMRYQKYIETSRAKESADAVSSDFYVIPTHPSYLKEEAEYAAAMANYRKQLAAARSDSRGKQDLRPTSAAAAAATGN